MDERRAVTEITGRLDGKVAEGNAWEAKFLLNLRMIESHRKWFNKSPDTPRGEVLARTRAKDV
jgi:hypothetical protein